jgi:hypothetical protein
MRCLVPVADRLLVAQFASGHSHAGNGNLLTYVQGYQHHTALWRVGKHDLQLNC